METLTLLLVVSSFKLELLCLLLLSWLRLAKLDPLSTFLKFPSSKGWRTLLPRPLMMNLTKSFLVASLHLRNHMMMTWWARETV